MEPRELAERTERGSPPAGDESERFAGYGVMGLPFASGHVLGMRRFPASSIGPGYTSIWHRSPDGEWTFYSDTEPLLSCNRYFGNEVDSFERAEIDIAWTGPRSISIRIPSADFVWDAEIAPSAATRLMNGLGGLMPEPMWRNGTVLDVMSWAARLLLGVGRVTLRGEAPNRQRYIANPRLMWTIPSSTASLKGEEFGPPGPLPAQAFIGDFAIPQRGMFVVGRAFFEPFDAARHLATPVRQAE